MMRKHSLLFLFLLLLASGLRAQLLGVGCTGVVKDRGDVFVERHGGKVEYPSLNQYGQILHYAPIVSMDSVQLSDTSITAACFYGKVLFHGWSPILSCGFDYATTSDFSGYQRKMCGTSVGILRANVSELSYNQQYYVRSFASNQYGITFGDTLSFHTTVGHVEIESVSVEVKDPYSFDMAVRIKERGGVPVYGTIALFTDTECQDTVINEPVDNLSTNKVNRTFSGLSPATTYYARTILTNGIFSDTVFSRVRTPSDLALSIMSEKAASVSLCTGGTSVTYNAVLTGSDRNKPHYDFHWTSSTGAGISHDTVFPVLYETAGSYIVNVTAFYGEDTLTANMEQIITARSGTASFYVCANEFLNTAEATTTNMASIQWLDRDNNIVATTKNVKLPTNHYTVECTDNYGCVQSKEVYVGKKKTSCIVTDSLGNNESGHEENGIWKVDSVRDDDGNWYAVAQVGTQCWTRQNLRTRHAPRDGLDLWNGRNETRTLEYKIYDPEILPFDGALYNWAAAMDTAIVPVDYTFDFTERRRGVCPQGWHIPQYEETWDMVEAVYNICCEGIEPTPPLRLFQTRVATNAPLRHMMYTECYDAMPNPEYPEEIYDITHLSLRYDRETDYGNCAFWIGNCAQGSLVSYVFYATYKEIWIGVMRRRDFYVPVRCVRDYPAE